MAECDKDYRSVQYIVSITRTSHCEKKLARILFDFGVVNTTDVDCHKQAPSFALLFQQLATSAV